VDFTTEDRSAVAPADYTTTFGTLTFPPGTIRQQIRIPVRGDNRYESNETFAVVLSNPFAANISGSTGIATVLDDDSGELDRFVWSEVPSPQYAGVAFGATLTALNGLNEVASEFNGQVTLAGVMDGREIRVGRGSNLWEFPLGALYHDARTQVILLPEELGGAARLTALALEVASVPGQALSNWTIRLQHTTRAAYSEAAWEAEGWTTVYRNDEAIQGPGWATFLFDQPFLYDGTNGLMVDLSFNNASYTTNGLIQASPTPRPRSISFQTDSAFGDPLRWSGRTAPPPSVHSRIPNFRFLAEFSAALSLSGPLQLANGRWTGLVTVQQTGSNVLLRASDREGHIAAGNIFSVLSSEDRDGDGLPDAWETQFFGSAAASGRDDPDRDGQDNLAEFRAGTDPNDPASATRIQSVSVRGRDLVIRFTGVRGKFYRLEWAEDLARGTWTAVSPELQGSLGIIEVVDAGAGASSSVSPRFYRLRILP
jgi:hypothetical protein